MQIHHGKHHQAYVNNLNAALEKPSGPAGQEPRRALPRHQQACPKRFAPPFATTAAATGTTAASGRGWRPNAGGAPTASSPTPSTRRSAASTTFKEQFARPASDAFGSGWAWLRQRRRQALDHEHAEPGQPADGRQDTPILGLDVWEHAYYLKYQNRRPDYLARLVERRELGRGQQGALSFELK